MSKYVTDLSFRHASIANTVIRSIYDLTLVEKRLILIALSGMDSSKEADPTAWFSMNIADYASLTNTTVKNAFVVLKEATETLFERQITIKGMVSPKSITKFRWIQAIRLVPEEDRIELQWSREIVPYITSLQSDFTRIFNREVVPLKSVYAIRLYLLLDQERYRGIKGSKEVAYAYLIEAWGVPETYQEFKYFKNVILNKAIEELKEAGLALVEISVRRINRKVEFITFKYTLEKRDSKSYITVEK